MFSIRHAAAHEQQQAHELCQAELAARKAAPPLRKATSVRAGLHRKAFDGSQLARPLYCESEGDGQRIVVRVSNGTQLISHLLQGSLTQGFDDAFLDACKRFRIRLHLSRIFQHDELKHRCATEVVRIRERCL